MSTTQTDFLSYLRTLTARQATGLLSDQQLLERFLHEHSDASFAALVARHGPMVLSVCRRVLQHAQDAEDAFQATFLVLARKAGSIRKQASLSSWLHGVAYRRAECLRAKMKRRAAHERCLSAPAPGDALDDITWRELRSVLDEELQRLPQKYRAPLVLCYLEGRTQDEAARQLGWSKNTFRRHLESGRNTLGRRLTRRGVTLSAALTAPLLIDAAAQAALPPLLAANTVRASLASATGQATGTLVSAQVAALVEGGTYTLLTKKASIALVLLVSLTLGVGGLLAHRAVHSRTFAEAPAAPPAAPPAKPQPQAAIEEKDDTIAVNGRVFDPDGKPFSGAKIYLIGSGDRPKKHSVRAVSGPDGRFQFTFSKTEYFEAPWIRIRPDMWRCCDLVAAAPGYGPAKVEMADVKKELSLHLAKEARINGRVRDLEGRPVEGAEVRAIDVSWYSLLNGATTDKEGRFRLTGVGRGVEMELRVCAPAIETQWIKVKTSADRPAGVEVLAGPTKPIEGIVRARDTGKPLAGVEVFAQRGGRGRWEPQDDSHLLRTITDDRGHYRLVGFPKGPHYELTAVPPVESGYVIAVQQAEDNAGLDPVHLDFDLRRGTIVRFRLIDKETGQPVRGAVQYSPLTDNPFWAEATHLEPGQLPPRVFMYLQSTERDNYIQFVAYTGPGLIVAHAGWGNRRYLNARLDPEDEKNGHYPGMKGDPLNGFATICPGYRRIDPKPSDRQLTFDIVLDPGRTLKGSLVDPAGRALHGVSFWGLGAVIMPQRTITQGEQILETAEFTAAGMERDKACILLFAQRERKLIGQQVVRPEDNGPLTARLQPWGALTGRLVDSEGKPLAGVKVRLKHPDSLDSVMRPENWEFTTDTQGRFRVEGLLPDRDHELVLEHGTKKDATLFAGDALKKLKTHAGEIKDLGDIAVKAR